MSVLGDIQKDFLESAFDTESGTGDEVEYKFEGGGTKKIIVVADIGNTRLPDAERKNRAYVDALFSFRSEDIPHPRSGDSIVYKGKTYTFYSIHARTLGVTIARFIYGRTATKFM